MAQKLGDYVEELWRNDPSIEAAAVLELAVADGVATRRTTKASVSSMLSVLRRKAREAGVEVPATTPSELVRIERGDDGIAVLTLNRPRALNAVTVALAEALTAALEQCGADPATRAVVLTGAGGRAFCAGVDLREASTMEVARVEEWFGAVCSAYTGILAVDKPVVAALNGLAAGAGFQMALVSDLRVAHRGVRMGQPEINAGLPSVMGSYWMTLHLGWAKNQELSYTGRFMDCEECERLGLFAAVVERADEVPGRARALARDLAAKAPVAFRRTKARFRELAMRGFEEAFRAGTLGQQAAYNEGEPQAIMSKFLARRS